MADKFVSVLDHIGTALKEFFTSPVVADVEGVGISIAEVVWPGLTPLFTAVQASIAKAQALAAAANVTGDTTAQVTALALSDAQQAFAAYEQSSGTKLETAQQQAIVQLVIQLLTKLPAPGNTGSAVSVAAAPAAPAMPALASQVSTRVAPAPITIVPGPASVAQQAPGAAVPAAVIDGPGLHNVVAQ